MNCWPLYLKVNEIGIFKPEQDCSCLLGCRDHFVVQTEIHSVSKETFLHGFFLGNPTYNLRFTGIHSSTKERQLPKCCVSFEKECRSTCAVILYSGGENRLKCSCPLICVYVIRATWTIDLQCPHPKTKKTLEPSPPTARR